MNICSRNKVKQRKRNDLSPHLLLVRQNNDLFKIVSNPSVVGELILSLYPVSVGGSSAF